MPEEVQQIPMAIIGHVQTFEPGRQKWTDYMEVMGQFFEANNIADGNRKRAILLSSVGPKTYTLIKDLCQPEAPNTKTYDELKTLVGNHFVPAKIEIVERYKFYTRARAKNETVQDYIAALRKLSENCNFGDKLNEMLRDRFVVGINNDMMLKKLLMESELTLEKSLKIAMAMQSAESGVKDLQSVGAAGGVPVSSSSHTSAPGSVNKLMFSKKKNKYPAQQSSSVSHGKPPQSSSKKQCYRCGSFHNPDTCRYINETCFKCKKKGHIKKKCHAKSVNRTHHLQEEEEEEGPIMYQYSMYNITDQTKVPPYKVTLGVNDEPLEFEIDTGCPKTLINRKVFESLKGVDLQRGTKTSLKTYTGSTVPLCGMCYVNVLHERLPLLVVDDDQGPSLLGRDWLEKLPSVWEEIQPSVNVNVLNMNDYSGELTVEMVVEETQKLWSEGIGLLKGVPAKVYYDRNAKPKFYKAASVPYALKDKIEIALDKGCEEDIMEPVRFSDWATPIVPVLKPDGTVRICGNFKLTVNQVSKLEQYPLPRLEDLLVKLGKGYKGKKWSKIDLIHAYNQMLLDDESRQLLTINTHKGLYRYKRLPFGISSGPAIFQRAIETLLQDLPGCVVSMDDVLVSGNDDQDHLRNLRAVCLRLMEAGVKAKWSKTELMKPEVVFLGHKIDEDGVHPVQDKVDAIHDAPAPTRVEELQSYLGLINYYHRFLPNISQKLAPLYFLLRKHVVWRWGHRQQKAFNESKALLADKVLIHYDPDLEVELSTDASSYGLGAVISHRMPDGSERPISFASRSLTAAEKNYSTLDREAAAVIFGVTKFYKYLYGRKFKIQVDHQPLVGIFNPGKAVPHVVSPRMQRWMLLLGAMEYTIEYRSGQKNQNADALSRLPLPTQKQSGDGDVVYMMDTLDSAPVTAEEIRKWTDADPVLAQVRGHVWKGWPESIHSLQNPMLQPYYQKKDGLSINDGCVMWGDRVVVPPQGRERVMDELHATHPGITKMKGLARSYVYWPGMEAELENKVKSCQSCQEHQQSPTRAPLHPWEMPSEPWRRVHADYGEVEGQMVFVMKDAYSKWIEGHVMTSTTSGATADKMREIFAVHGLPEVLVTDNAANLTSSEMENFLEKNGIAHVTSAPYHPSSNGLAENAVKTVKSGLKKVKGGSLKQRLSRVLFNYRITPQYGTGQSPAELLMKRKLRTRLDLLHPNWAGKVAQKQAKMKSDHDKISKDRQFHVGDFVSVKNYGQYGPKWLPGTVSQVTGPVSYKVVLQDGREVRKHVDQIISRRESTISEENHKERFPEVDVSEERIPEVMVPTSDIRVQEQRLPEQRYSEQRNQCRVNVSGMSDVPSASHENTGEKSVVTGDVTQSEITQSDDTQGVITQSSAANVASGVEVARRALVI